MSFISLRVCKPRQTQTLSIVNSENGTQGAWAAGLEEPTLLRGLNGGGECMVNLRTGCACGRVRTWTYTCGVSESDDSLAFWCPRPSKVRRVSHFGASHKVSMVKKLQKMQHSRRFLLLQVLFARFCERGRSNAGLGVPKSSR